MMDSIKTGITKNKQPIKEISYQDIHEISDLLERLSSWEQPLKILDDFFSEKSNPVNKKKIVKEYHAFHFEFGNSIQRIEGQIEESEKGVKKRTMIS
ncbi:hypothetical protein BCR23_12740 [Enterococcus quebecensis]|uniref:Uncharacterized protein n=2 Tax=Enterococcus quebecensis TaxID=903983 RepID=A0A1E5GPV7_9ENTE|nr:hypothetical protein BCR23_12740 [Enterococcus quebecensis]